MTDLTSGAPGITIGSDTFDPDQARRRSAPWSTGVRGLAGLAVLLVVLGHVGTPLVGDGTVGADLLFVILGFEIVVWAAAHRTGITPRSRHRVLAPLVLVAGVSVGAALWWSWSTSTGQSSSTMWWDHVGHELTVAGQDAVGVPGMWTQSLAWPTSSAVMALLALSATVVIALILGWVLRRLSLAGRPVSERTLLLVSCVVFGTVIVFAVSVVLDLVPAASVAGPAVAVAQRAWEMTLGALVGGLVVTGSLPDRIHPVLGSASLAFVGIAVVKPELLDIPHGVLVGIAGALLLAAVTATRPSRGLTAIVGSGPLQVTGRFGYCWYLWHLPAVLLAPLVLGSSPSWLQRMELILLAFWAGGLTYAILGRRRVGGGSLPIEDHPHVHGHASAHLPTALRSWNHAPRAAAGVGTQAGPAPHFGPPAGTTSGGRS